MARIGINATSLDPGRTGGAETYVRELIGSASFQQALATHEVVVFAGTPADPALKASPFEVVRCPVDPRRRNTRILWEQTDLPRLFRRHRLDLVHFPYSSTCWSYSAPQVVTVHDTINFIMPRTMSVAERVYRKILQHRFKANPRCRIIAVSNTDASVLRRHLKLEEKRTAVVYHGRPEAFVADPETVGAPRPGGDLLWVGRPYLHKNVELLVRMMAELVRRRPGRVPTLHMVGVDREASERLGRLAGRLGVRDVIRFSPPRPHGELPALFQSARLLVFPSLIESFGLPPLEALCAGTPVVCSDLAIFREILGEAACFADPHDAAAFAGQCERLLDQPELWTRQARAGHAHSRRYTWDRCAEETVAVYEDTLRRGPG